MLYDSPCDDSGYYFCEYGYPHINENDFFDEDQNDEPDEILEVNWESPR